jgi:flagellar biosynthetic protein FliR
MFMAITIAGGIISLQIGLTSALLFDASAGGQVPVLSKLMNIAAVLVCMGLGVHHLWIATLVHSYSLFPVGTLPPAKDFLDLAIMTAGRTMAIGLGLSAPLVIYGLVFNMALGLASRLAPAIQIFFIAQPLNLLGGIALLMLLIGSMLAAFANSLSDWTMAIWG